MRPDVLLSSAVRLVTSAEALAALAAHVRVETEDLDVDPAIRDLLARVAAEVLGQGGDAADGPVPQPAGQAVLGMARAFLRQCIDLVEAPAHGRT